MKHINNVWKNVCIEENTEFSEHPVDLSRNAALKSKVMSPAA